eukprot:1140813-Pelagomonas_calceolata.AAC.2
MVWENADNNEDWDQNGCVGFVMLPAEKAKRPPESRGCITLSAVVWTAHSLNHDKPWRLRLCFA